MKKTLIAIALFAATLASTQSFAGYQSAMVQQCDAVGNCFIVNEPVDTNPPPCWM